MPELVQHEGKVNNLREGDLLVVVIDGEDESRHVTDITKKQAWATIAVDGLPKPLRKRLDDVVRYERSEKTAEEKAEDARSFARDSMMELLDRWLNDTPLKRLEAIVAKARETGGDLAYNVLTWSNLPDVLRAQAKHKVALSIRNLLVTDADPTYDELVNAFARWWISTHGALQSYPDPLSRSTGTISNLLEDLDDWAVDELKSKLWFMAIRDHVLVRVEEIQKERDAVTRRIF